MDRIEIMYECNGQVIKEVYTGSWVNHDHVIQSVIQRFYKICNDTTEAAVILDEKVVLKVTKEKVKE
ncbi:MAG: hypothetical protein QW531_04875 [Thermoplasmata archaeon]